MDDNNSPSSIEPVATQKTLIRSISIKAGVISSIIAILSLVYGFIVSFTTEYKACDPFDYVGTAPSPQITCKTAIESAGYTIGRKTVTWLCVVSIFLYCLSNFLNYSEILNRIFSMIQIKKKRKETDVESLTQKGKSGLLKNVIWGVIMGIGFLFLLIMCFANGDYVTLLKNETVPVNTNTRLFSLLGVIFVYGILFAVSKNRKTVNLQIISSGFIFQILIAFACSGNGLQVVKELSNAFIGFMQFSMSYGMSFLLFSKEFPFIAKVAAQVTYFAAFVSVLFYLGIMQKILKVLAWGVVRLMPVSGAEAIVAIAAPFIGQGECAIVVAPLMEHMTDSELHSILTSGFSTIAGSILGLICGIGGKNPVFQAGLFLPSMLMSIPCSLAYSKIRYPETQSSLSKGKVIIPEGKEDEAQNIIHAAANGAGQGLHISGLIAASILVIYSAYKVTSFVFQAAAGAINSDYRIEDVMSFVFYPFAFFISSEFKNVKEIAVILAQKTVINEYIAFESLSQSSLKGFEFEITALAICGFANFTSIGVQVGCLGYLAPSKKGKIASMALSSMFVGALCTLSSAYILAIIK